MGDTYKTVSCTRCGLAADSRSHPLLLYPAKPGFVETVLKDALNRMHGAAIADGWLDMDCYLVGEVDSAYCWVTEYSDAPEGWPMAAIGGL